LGDKPVGGRCLRQTALGNCSYVQACPHSYLRSLEVIDGNGVRQIIKLRDLLMLPPPEHAQQ
jgi:hypothetical protein